MLWAFHAAAGFRLGLARTLSQDYLTDTFPRITTAATAARHGIAVGGYSAVSTYNTPRRVPPYQVVSPAATYRCWPLD